MDVGLDIRFFAEKMVGKTGERLHGTSQDAASTERSLHSLASGSSALRKGRVSKKIQVGVGGVWRLVLTAWDLYGGAVRPGSSDRALRTVPRPCMRDKRRRSVAIQSL